MSNNNRNRGLTLERETVKLFQGNGYEAQRTWGYKDVQEKIDVEVQLDKVFTIQCKRTKKLPKKYLPPKGVDATIYREDGNKESYIMMSTKDFIRRFLC